MRFAYGFLFLLLIQLSWPNVAVCADEYNISQLSIQNGLSNNSVRCIYQDKKGFIWFGTYDGLNRYDGTEFKTFRNRISDSTSLPHNYIYTVHEDAQHNIWVGTGQGLSIYNANTGRFSTATFYPYDYHVLSKAVFNANIIESDQDGNVYIGTNGWGLLVKKANEKAAQQIPILALKKAVSGYNVRSICVVKNKVWLSVLDVGLCSYDIGTGKIDLVNTSIKSGTSLLADKSGNIWIGSDNGLYQYQTSTNQFLQHFQVTQNQLNSTQITSLCFDAQGKLWIGTDGGGVNILDPVTKTFSYILPEEGKNKLSSESVYSIIQDRESRMWIGTLKAGVHIIDNQKNQFINIARNPLKQNTLSSNFIYSFCEDQNQNLLVGTDGGGLSIWNRKQNSFTNFKHIEGNAQSLSHNSVTSIKQDYLGNIWIGTFGGGINKLNTKTGKFEHYACFNTAENFENINVWLLYQDKSNTMWASTFSRGRLYRFNQGLNKFELFNQEFENLIALLEDDQGNLWGGNASQLFKIDKNNQKHLQFNIGKPIRAIYEDKKHNFWLGIEGGGLVLFDRAKGEIKKRYSDANGLCNNAVLNIKEDHAGNLWLSTFNGLSKFDPITEKFKNFYQSDGLQSNQFSYNAALQLQSGELVFGGINGFSLFNPDQVLVRTYMPSLYITDIQINNKPLSDVQEFVKEIDDLGIKSIQIPYHEAVLSFRFNALEFASPEKIQYAYLLNGWDKNWNYTGNAKNINFNNITEGTYQLRIKSTNSNGEWNSKETILQIIILPPWYRTWWAYTLYILIIGAIVFIIIQYKINQDNLKFKVKLTELNAEKERAVNESRQAFFTNIVHEFRTPLALIINPIKDILHKDSNDGDKSELNFVYRNARRLLSLVDQLLLFRKTESDTGVMQISKLNFSQLCQDTFLYFAQQAKNKNIQYEFICPNQNIEIFGDKEKLEIIFYNLLSNALKYTADNGSISLKLIEHADSVEIEVADNGQGIPNDVGNKLFEKYYRVNDLNNPLKPGFGIGLYLVKQFIENHHGTIDYKSAPSNGTVFHISLLKGKAHFGDIELRDIAAGQNLVLDEIRAGNDGLTDLSPQVTNGLELLVTEKKTMLVVDDNDQMRSYLSQIFSADFVVHEAVDGDQGLQMAKEQQPDIIISDVVMKHMTGIDFCRSIKETAATNHIPFILLTGSTSSESKLKGIEYGADDYITKPFEKDFLVARVSSLLRNQQNLQKYFYNEITHQENSLKISGEYKEFLENCIAIVEKHLDNDDFNIQLFAQEIGMSHSKLYKKIKTISGQSANAFIRFIRLRKAAEMFINTNYNVNETAFYVGIKDIKYFREQFQKTFGLKPSEYIEKYRKNLGKSFQLNEKLTKN